MKKHAISIAVGLSLSALSGSVLAYGGWILDFGENGWVYPVNYERYESCALFGQYDGHVGTDFCRPNKTEVYAIADGCVDRYSSAVPSYGDA